MNTAAYHTHVAIEAHQVPDEARIHTLHRHFSLVLRAEGNGYEGLMSSQAAGITACLFSFSHLSFRIADEVISSHFHQLRDFAVEHREGAAILAAID